MQEINVEIFIFSYTTRILLRSTYNPCFSESVWQIGNLGRGSRSFFDGAKVPFKGKSTGDAALIHGKLFAFFLTATKESSSGSLCRESPWWWWAVYQRQLGFSWLR